MAKKAKKVAKKRLRVWVGSKAAGRMELCPTCGRLCSYSMSAKRHYCDDCKVWLKRPAVRTKEGTPPTDAEFEREWMDENGMAKGESWGGPGRPAAKGACEARLADGTVVGPCWPDGGAYRRLDGEADLKAGDVVAVRFYEDVGPGVGKDVEDLLFGGQAEPEMEET
jgi:hypothetical protein